MARVPIGTTQWGDDLNADLDSIEAQINNHKQKQGSDNPHGLTPADIGAAEAGNVIYHDNADDAPDGTVWISGAVPITPTNGYPDGVAGAVATLTTHTANDLDYRVQTLVTEFGQEWRRLKRGDWLPWEASAPIIHANRHATGGPDEITPESINALPMTQPYLLGDLNDAPEGTVRLGEFGLPNMPTTEVGFLTTQHPVDGNPSARGHGVQTYVSRPSGQVYVRTASGDIWGDWIRVDIGAVTPESIGAEPTIQDTQWRRILSWTDGVQDSTGQVGTVNTSAYTLIGSGFLDIRRRDNYVMFRSEFAVSGGGAIRSLTTTPERLFSDFTMPPEYQPNSGNQWGIMLPIGYRGVERLLIGSPINQVNFGFCTPDRAPLDIRGIAGGYPCTYPFPSEPYIGTPMGA